MLSSVKTFIFRMSAILALLTCFILLAATLEGSLSLIGGICLLPAAMYLTLFMVQNSARPVRRAAKPRPTYPAKAAMPRATAPACSKKQPIPFVRPADNPRRAA